MKHERFDHIGGAMRNPGVVGFLVVVLVLFGIYALPRINKDEFPAIVIRQGVVAAIYPGATAEEIEEQVTAPLEACLATYTEIDQTQTRSVTEDGVVYIYATLNTNVERKDEAWAKIRAGLNLAKLTSLPQGVLQVVVVDDFGATSSILLTVESPDRSPRQIEDYTSRLCDRLRAIPAMGNIRILGQRQEEIAVTLDLEKLSAYGVNQTSLMAQMMTMGFRTVGGSLESPQSQTMLQVALPYSTEYEIGEQIVYSDPVSGATVRLKDIATIDRRYQKPSKYVEYYEKGLETSCLIVSMEMAPGNNIVDFGKEVDKILAQERPHIPADIHFHRIADQPKAVGSSVNSFLRDLGLSIIIVILVMLLLFPLRTALIASTSVPVCTMVAIGIMYLVGFELNTVTLAALMVCLGMIVDDSVIVIDGYSDLFDRGYSRWYSANVSTKQLFAPMAVATCAIAFMFFPAPHIIKGPIGEFAALFPWMMLFALGASIFYAVWVIPGLCVRFTQRSNDKKLNWFERGQHKFFDKLQSLYHKLLDRCFRHPWGVIGAGIGAVALGLVLFTQVNIQLMPKVDRDCFAVEISLSPSASIDQTAEIADSLARVLRADERVLSVTSFVGQGSPRFHITYTPSTDKTSFAQFIVKTKSTKATMEVLHAYTDRYANAFPGAYVRFKQLDYQFVQNPTEVYVRGRDWKQMEAVADQIKGYMATMPELTWVHSDYDEIKPAVQLVLKEDEASRLGISQAMLSVYLASMTGGQTLTTIPEGSYTTPVTLYTAGVDTITCESVANLLIPTAFPGQWVPVREVAEVVPTWHHATLVRTNSVPTITVSADMNGKASAPAAVKKIKKYVQANVEPNLPEGVSISYGGLQALNGQVGPQMIGAIIAALAVMFVLMLFHFGKVSTAALSLAFATFCLFGTFLGLIIFQQDYSMTVLLGMLNLISIIVRNAIIMYEYAEHLRKDLHYSARQAGFEAGLRRMRPIFLTSATTALGVLPMIFAGTPLWMPMGVVICIGTIFTLPLTITVMPVVYWKVYNKQSPDNAPEKPTSNSVQVAPKVATLGLLVLLLCLPLQGQAQTLSLDSCLTLASQNNLSLRNAQLDVLKAQEVKKQAFTQYFPSVSATAGGFHALNPMVDIGPNAVENPTVRNLLNTLYQNYGKALGIPSSLQLFDHGYVASVMAVQPVFAGGQIVNGNKLAQVGVEAARLQADLKERTLLQEVEESYWLVVSLQQKLLTLQTGQSLLDTVSKYVDAAVSAGMAIENDRLQVAIKRNEMQRNDLQLHNGLILAKQALCQSIGVGYTDSIAVVSLDSLPDLADTLALPSPASQAAQRVETRLLGLQVEAEQLQKKMTVGKTLPTVALGASYVGKDLFFDQWDNNLMGFFMVKVPLTDWWKASHELRSQDLAIEQARNTQQQLSEQLVLQTSQYYNQLLESRKQMELSKSTVESAKENLRLAQLNYQAGRQTMSDLLQAQTLYCQAMNDYTDAFIDYQVALRRYQSL